jgi:putative phosphoesterase
MRLLLISDVQGNLAALDAALLHPDALGADLVLCLGDVASGPRPAATIARLQEIGAHCLFGNMDGVIADPPEPSGDGDDRRFAELDLWCHERLSPEQHGWLRALPSTFELAFPGGRRLFACHGSPRSPEVAIGAETPEADVRAAFAGIEADLIAVGHLHEPMLRRVGDLLLLHPGSVGWPRPLADGRRPRWAEFAAIEGDGSTIRVAMHRVPYREEEQRRDVIEGGMPSFDWYLDLWRDP